jgi:hypothetical protein
MYRIKNTADDRSKHLLHRTASQFELEPNIGGKRIRLRSHLDISDEHYGRVKHMVDAWEKKGIVEVTKLVSDSTEDLTKVGSDLEFTPEGLRLGGPTFEVWTEKLQQPPESYPPEGFAEVFSPGLVTYRRAREEAISQAVTASNLPIVEEIVEEPAPPPVTQEPLVAPPSMPSPAVLPSSPPKNKKLR